jgi:hypothetical protein
LQARHKICKHVCCADAGTVLQAGAEVLVQPTAAVAREVSWELTDALLSPCSLFDAGDTLLLHRSMMELANSNTEQAAAMQAAFFGSSKVGLMCWHSCC